MGQFQQAHSNSWQASYGSHVYFLLLIWTHRLCMIFVVTYIVWAKQTRYDIPSEKIFNQELCWKKHKEEN